jgi:hypothetical protein
MIRSDYIKSFSVKVTYKLQGSGVLVKVDENNCYLITAKHNFRKRDREDINRISIENIDFKSISVIREDGKEFYIKEYIYDYDDFVIFYIEGEIKALDSIQILTEKPTDKMEYFAYGYPANKNEGHILNRLSSRNDIKSYHFEIGNRDNTPTKYAEGFSGSGVFTEDENSINYLCGIILKNDDSYHTLTIFNLSAIILNINEKLKEKGYLTIPVKESNFYLKDIDNMYGLILNHHTDNFLVQKVKSFFGKEHQYEDLIQPSLKDLNEYINYTNQFKVIEYTYTQKIADMYLLSAFISSKYQEKEEALKYLNRAIKYRPKYTIFLAEIDKENSKEELFKSAKLYYTDGEYKDSYNFFQKILSLKLEKNEEIIVYEYLVRITKIWNNKYKLIEYYTKLLNLYEDDFQMAKVYYELSLIEKKEASISYANKGINLIGFYNDLLEIKYLLYKRIYELNQDEQLFPILKSTLEQLVLIEPKYKYELSTLNYAKTLDRIGIGTYIASLIFILLILFLGGLLKFWNINYLTSSIAVFLFTIVAFLTLKMTKIILWVNIVIFCCVSIGLMRYFYI